MVDRKIRDRRDQAARKDDHFPSDLVGQPAEHQEERRAQGDRPEHDRVRLLEGQLEIRRHEEVRLELTLVPDDALTRGEAEEDQKNRPDLAAAEGLAGPVAGAGDGLLRLLEAREERRLLQLDPDVEREDNEDRRDPERISPAL